MPIATYTLNGVPIEDYGLYVISTGGALSVPSRSFKTAELALRDGQRALSEASRTEPRTVQLGLRIEPSTLADRRTKLNTLFRELRGQVELATVEDVTKVCYGLLHGADVSHFGDRPFAILPLKADVALVCHDPLWYDADPVIVAIPAVNTAVEIPMGVASARTRRLRIRINGATTSPVTIILKDSAGAELARMTIATATSSAEYLEIDCDAFTITKWSAGVGTDVTGTLTVTHTFFELEAVDGMTLQTDKGTAEFALHRAYVS